MRQLKRVGHAKKNCLIHDGADELQTNGQALGRSTARDGNSRKPSKIRRAVVAQQEGACRVSGTDTMAREAGGLFTDERCGDGSRGQGQGIQSAIGHHGKQAAKEGFAQLQGLEIGGGRHLGAKFQAFPNIFTILCRALAKPAGLLMVMGCLGPSDLIAGIFGLAKKRDRDPFEARAHFAKNA